MSEYLRSLSSLYLQSIRDNGFKVLDLFAGCGGLALGFESVGFHTHGYECDTTAVATYNANLSGTCREEYLTPDTTFPRADIIIGGPPCQPFSVGGKQQGLKDSRDGFPAYLEAVRQIRPRLCLIENVRGMLYKNKKYLMEVSDALNKLGYIVSVKLVKAVELGVPQNRERVIIVGHYGGFTFPRPFSAKYTAGDAVGDIAYQIEPDSRFLTKSQDAYVAKYEKASKCKNPRDLHMDRPARTVTCRNLAGATGDMHRILLPDGRRKRITVREAARLQSFPDWFEFEGNESAAFNQIGNAVPPMMARALALSVLAYLNGDSEVSVSDKQLELEL